MSTALYLQFASGEVHHNRFGTDHPDSTPISKARYLTLVRENAQKRLREILKPGQCVHTIVSHRSRSGMSRSIRCIVTDPFDGEPMDISYSVASAIGWRIDQSNGGVKVDGCGMDMAFHLVYTLARTLWPEGTDKAGEHAKGDGGYALTARSL